MENEGKSEKAGTESSPSRSDSGTRGPATPPLPAGLLVCARDKPECSRFGGPARSGRIKRQLRERFVFTFAALSVFAILFLPRLARHQHF